MAPGFLGANQCEPGGAAALGSPYGGAGERSETERAYAVANMEICAEIAAGYPLSHGYAVPALPKGEPRGGRSPPSAEGNTVRIRRRSRPWLPQWGSWRALSEPERAWAVASLHIGAVIAAYVPSQSRPPPTIEPGDPQRCGSIARAADSNCQRGHPAVLTFCKPSPARLPIYRQCTPPRLPGRWGSGWGSGATCGSRSLWLSGGRCPGRSGRSGRPGRRG